MFIYDLFHRDDFNNEWAANAASEQSQATVASLKFFIEGFNTAGAIGMGALGGGSLASPKQFSYTPKFNGLRNNLIKNEYFVNSRSSGYWNQPGHAQFPKTTNSITIRNGNMHWNANNGSYRFSIRGYRNGNSGQYDLGVRPDGGIFHSTFYKFK